MGFLSTFGHAFVSSDALWMWIILAVQVVCLGIIIERSVALYMNRKPNQKNLAKMLNQEIQAGNLEGALKKAKMLGQTNPMGVVASAGLQAAMDLGGKEEIQLRMDEVLLEENSRVEKRLSFLAMFANVATLMGLLGTIAGLIQSFSAISKADPALKAQILSEGISLAMNTTAYGLIVAVPALIMYAVLQNRASKLVDDLNKAALNIFIQLSCRYEAVPTRKNK